MQAEAEHASATVTLRYRGIRVLEVIRARNVTPRMRRITLGGPEIEGFGSGPNLKVLIPPRGLQVPEWPLTGPDGRAIWPSDERRPTVRTYSMRRFDPNAGELDVDFVLHGDHGVASRWAAQAKAGDVVGIGGPGGRTVAPADFYLLAGDHTALPAISAILEKLPPDARGHALIEIPDALEEQSLTGPAGVGLTWLHQDTPEPDRLTLLEEAVRALAWPENKKIFAWIGCESRSMRAIRSYVRDERGLNRRSFLAIGYWRRGMSETAYHDAYNNDRDEDYYKTFADEMREGTIPPSRR